MGRDKGTAAYALDYSIWPQGLKCMPSLLKWELHLACRVMHDDMGPYSLRHLKLQLGWQLVRQARARGDGVLCGVVSI